MVELRWIKMSLFLILRLQFTAVTGQTLLSFTVRDGDDVTLSCENVINDQDKCDSTTWIFSRPRSRAAAVELIKLGQIGKKAKAKSDRLSVTANCSLVIKKVTVEDVGLYICRQLKSGKQQGQDSQVYLSVVTLTEHKDTDKVMLNCSVSTYDECRHTVKWVYEGNDQDVITQHMKESQSSCFANVKFITSSLTETSKYSELFKCSLTQIYTGKVQLFAFSPQSSVLFAVRLRFIIVSVGLAALIITVVSVNIGTRIKGNKTQMDDKAVHNDEDGDEDTVDYENDGEPSASVRRH